MQPGRQIPDAVALGEYRRRPLDLIARGEKVQPGALAPARGEQGVDDVVGDSDAGLP